MRRYLGSIIFLAAAVWLGVKLKTDPGYLLIATKHWTAETPLWFAIIILLIAFMLLYSVVRLFKYSHSLSDRWQSWGSRRRKVKAMKQTNRGLIELAEGNWKQAENLLKKSAHDSDEPLLNYLALAFAAQGQKNYERRAEYLYQAHNIEPDANMAIGITQAQLQINHHQYEQAVATLRHMHDISPKQQQVLRLLKLLYSKLNYWQQLQELLPLLKKHGGYPEEKYNAIVVNVYQHLFAQLPNVIDVEKAWDELRSHIQQHNVVVLAYVQRLIDLQAHELAETAIRKVLKKYWVSDVVALYGGLNVNVREQLKAAMKWLDEHQQDAKLLATIGELSVRNELLGQAYDYYQASISIEPNIHTYFLLAQLCEKMGNKDESLECYKQGLTFCVAQS